MRDPGLDKGLLALFLLTVTPAFLAFILKRPHRPPFFAYDAQHTINTLLEFQVGTESA